MYPLGYYLAAGQDDGVESSRVESEVAVAGLDVTVCIPMRHRNIMDRAESGDLISRVTRGSF